MPFQSYLYTFICLLSITTNAWVIDKSCNEVATQIDNAMAHVFQMATAGKDALDKITATPPNGDPYEVQLAHTLLGADESKYDGVKLRFEKMLADSLSIKGTDINRNVIVQCGMSSWGTPVNGILTHKNFPDLTARENDDFKSCRSGTPRHAAYTSYFREKADERPSVITLCDGFMKALYDGKFHTNLDLSNKFKVNLRDFASRMSFGSNSALKPQLPEDATEIDVMYLLDAVLFHELTHTQAASIDEPLNPTKYVKPTTDAADPGWKNRIGLNDPSDAESLAYFCLTVDMGRATPKLYVGKEGGVSQTPLPLTKRAAIMISRVMRRMWRMV